MTSLMPRKNLARVVAVGAFVLACESSTDVIATDRFDASLSGRAVRPDSLSVAGASGSFAITLTSDTSALHYELTFTGLTTTATAAHIHGPAADSAIAEVLVDFGALPQGRTGTINLGTAGAATGSFDLHDEVTATVSGDSLFKLLHAGLLYVDVHTAQNSAGEIRGQIRK